jgi:hypothetical protein
LHFYVDFHTIVLLIALFYQTACHSVCIVVWSQRNTVCLVWRTRAIRTTC